MIQEEAKKKAEELVSKYSAQLPYYTEKDNLRKAKQCALISIDYEFRARLEEIEKISEFLPVDIYAQAVIFTKKELEEIKQEIEKL